MVSSRIGIMRAAVLLVSVALISGHSKEEKGNQKTEKRAKSTFYASLPRQELLQPNQDNHTNSSRAEENLDEPRETTQKPSSALNYPSDLFYEVKPSTMVFQNTIYECENGDSPNLSKKPVRIEYPAVVFADEEAPKRLNWKSCTESIPTEVGKQKLKSPLQNGFSKKHCSTNEDCVNDFTTKLKCYRPTCTCQKAKLQVFQDKNEVLCNSSI